MSIQIVSSRIKRPPDRQCIGIGWLTSGNFQLGCLLGRLLGYEGKSKIIISRLFSFILISRNFLLLHKLGTKILLRVFYEKISWKYTNSYLFQLVVVELGFVGGPFGLPPSIVGCTTFFLILVETFPKSFKIRMPKNPKLRGWKLRNAVVDCSG